MRILLLLTLLLSACVHKPIPDGLYAVTDSNRDAVLVERDDEPGQKISLARSSRVPLVLAAAPVRETDARGRALLGVTLAPAQVGALESFTRAHLGGRAAFVLDGRAITVHKIRAVITGGRMQITRCGDDRCELLYSRLAAH